MYWLLRAPSETSREIGEALLGLAEGVTICGICCDLGGGDPCGICTHPGRDPGLVLVVEQPQDIRAFERSGEYRGRYHVLHGAISPLDGVGADQLKVRELLERLRDGVVTEVILATDPDVEGDATALYISRLLTSIEGVRVTRLAHGISVGTAIEYADAMSLARALENRRAF